ncbi:hypothetical protein BGZ46_008934, partial [Entomortierella lignicola]
MPHFPHFPWSNKHTPEELLALATIDLKSARNESDPKKSLKLIDKAKSNIDKAEKILSDKKCKDLSLEESIANAYYEHGELLDKLGDSKHTQESHRKAKEWGYTHKVSEHAPSSQSVSDPKIVQFSNDTLSQGTASSTVDGVKYIESRAVGHIPCNIFNKDGTLKTSERVLPEIELEPKEQDWILKIKENADEKERLDDMADDMVRVFAQDVLKNHEEIKEVVWLAPHLDQQHFRRLLQILLSGINDHKLLEVSMVDGLVRMIRNARQMKFESDDLVKVLDLLCSRLENTHDQSTQQIFKLTLAVSAVLDSMADNNVEGLSREQLHGPLFKYLEHLQDKPEPYLMYQAAYAFQAL